MTRAQRLEKEARKWKVASNHIQEVWEAGANKTTINNYIEQIDASGLEKLIKEMREAEQAAARADLENILYWLGFARRPIQKKDDTEQRLEALDRAIDMGFDGAVRWPEEVFGELVLPVTVEEAKRLEEEFAREAALEIANRNNVDYLEQRLEKAWEKVDSILAADALPTISQMTSALRDLDRAAVRAKDVDTKTRVAEWRRKLDSIARDLDSLYGEMEDVIIDEGLVPHHTEG